MYPKIKGVTGRTGVWLCNFVFRIIMSLKAATC